MANFEGLIRQALQNQNAGDPAVRQRIYQSSRNALAKMLQNSPDVGDEAAQRQFDRLEASIVSIEADYIPQEQAAPQEPAEPLDVVPSGTTPGAPAAAPELSIAATASEVEELQQVLDTSPGPAAAAPAASEETDPILAMLEQASLGTTGAPVVASPESEPDTLPGPPAIDEPSAGGMAANDPTAPYLDEPQGLQDYKPEPLFPLPQSEPSVDVDPQIGSPAPNTGGYQTTSAPQPGILDESPPMPQPAMPEPRPVEADLGDAPAGFDRAGDSASAASPPQSDLDSLTAEREPYPVYNRKNPILRRIWPIALVLGILLVILWLMYALFTNMGENGASNGQSESPGPVGETQLSDDGSATITLLEPTDLSALVTAGRGTAELTTVQNEQMLRLQSVRQDGQTGESAQPILLEMERGVLQQIMGKPVTVELYAKSGLSGPAQFAIECSVAGESVCGRKRFRVGQQPERIVFSMDLKNVGDAGARAFLAMNTDITTEADTSGKGDIIDLIYARLRFEP
ncbi:MAG: hypothetical protein KDJ69_13430 [Nitratireductor sp.]|nr:hypothetical protein [Nitratireductor sp.]